MSFLDPDILTIPPETCDVLHGRYHDYKMARFGCSIDDGCIAVVDSECDRIGPFQLCDKKRLKEGTKRPICNYPSLKNKGRSFNHIPESDVLSI